jgi:hypothetical protein
LDEAGIPHAFGGAIALAFYAQPRQTIDIDLNVFVPEEDAERVLEALVPLRIPVSDEQASALQRDGQVRLRWGVIPLDLFLMNIPLLESAASRAVTQDLGDLPIPVLAAEDLLICKAAFNRLKDWADIEEVAKFRAADIDSEYLLSWLREVLGDTDARIERMRQLFPD